MNKLSRHALLGLSIVLAMLVDGVVLSVAPRVTFQGLGLVPRQSLRHYRVQLREEPAPAPKPAQESTTGGRGHSLSTQPGSIEDLLKRENEALAPTESLLRSGTGIPRLAERVASEVVPREHDLTPNPEVLAKVDTRIVEIAEDAARQDIEIARRLVTPSPQRIVGENEFPVLRGPSEGEEPPLSFGNLPTVSLLNEPAHAPGEGAGPGAAASEGNVAPPPIEEPATLPEPLPLEPLILPELEEIARAPVVEQVRKESPYEFIDDLVDIKMETYVPAGESEGYFQLQIIPKQGKEIPAAPKDVTFVIDASSSILQRKLDATVKAVKEMVARLHEPDRFNVVIFRESTLSFQPELVPATSENKAAAAAFLGNVKSTGQTDFYNALRPVIETPPRDGVPGIVVVVTDGRPTAGVRDARTIINDVTAQNTHGNTIFAYGGGNTVNQYLLDLLAYRNKGEAHVIPNIDAMTKDLEAYFSLLNEPILARLHANYGQVDGANIFPKDLPDFYKGRAATVYGRFKPRKENEFVMRLAGTTESRKKEVIFKGDLRKATRGDEQIARNWAFQKVYFLIGEICRLGEQPELLNEIQRLSKQYGIRTIYSE